MTKRPSHSTESSSTHSEATLGTQCPMCATEYTQDDMRVLEQRGGTKLLHITCSTCHHAMLTFVMTSQLGTSSIGMLTDLSMQDVTRLRRRAPLDEDAVLAMHTVLAQETSSLIHLLK